MKTYYSVRRVYDLTGLRSIRLSGTIEAETIPRNCVVSTVKCALYTDWFATITEAMDFIKREKP